jgi:hypothetical protein
VLALKFLDWGTWLLTDETHNTGEATEDEVTANQTRMAAN